MVQVLAYHRHRHDRRAGHTEVWVLAERRHTIERIVERELGSLAEDSPPAYLGHEPQPTLIPRWDPPPPPRRFRLRTDHGIEEVHGRITFRNARGALHFLLERYVPSREDAFDRLVVAARTDEAAANSLQRLLHDGRLDDLEIAETPLLPWKEFSLRGKKETERDQEVCFYPDPDDETAILVHEFAVHVRGHAIPRRQLLIPPRHTYASRSRQASWGALFFDGERWQTLRRTACTEGRTLRTFAERARLYGHAGRGNHPLPNLRVRAAIRIPARDEVDARSLHRRRRRHALLRQAALVYDSRQPLPFPAELPIVGGVVAGLELVSRTRNGVYVPELAPHDPEELLARLPERPAYALLCEPRLVRS